MDRIVRVHRGADTFFASEERGELRRVDGDVFGRYTLGPAVGRVGSTDLRLLPPVTPSKIVCVGLNYRDHAGEVGKALPAEPLIFIKPTSAVIGPGEAIRMPPGVGRVDHEAELGVVIGRRAHRVPAADAWSYVRGLICVNDVTARDLQKKESQYTRCKGF